MDALRDINMIVVSEQVPGLAGVAAGVSAGSGDLRRAVRSGAAADHDSADGPARHPAGNVYRDHAVEEVVGSREAHARGVEDGGRKNVLLLQAQHLFAFRFGNQAQRVRRGRMGDAVIDRIDSEQAVVIGEGVVPKSSRMFCTGWLKASAMPPPNSGPFAAGQRFSKGCTAGTAAAREALSGTRVTSLKARFWRKPS